MKRSAFLKGLAALVGGTPLSAYLPKGEAVEATDTQEMETIFLVGGPFDGDLRSHPVGVHDLMLPYEMGFYPSIGYGTHEYLPIEPGSEIRTAIYRRTTGGVYAPERVPVFEFWA